MVREAVAVATDESGRPRERLVAQGPAGLTDLELVTLLVSPGNSRLPGELLARRLLGEMGPLRRLPTRRAGELAAMPGVGLAKACRLLAAFELGKRAMERCDAAATLATPEDAHTRWARLATEADEVFVAVAVNSRNRVTGEWVVARGWESGVNLTPRQVFTLLVKEGVGRVVFLHNHPSGDPTPSAEDLRFTRRLVDAARPLDIKVLDHVVVAADGHRSIRAQAPDVFTG